MGFSAPFGQAGATLGRDGGWRLNAVRGAVGSAAVGVGCTCFKLRSLARRVTQLYDRTLAPAGLKVTQYSLLAHVRRRAPQAAPTVSELAQALFTDRTTLTRNLKPLIERGLIEVGQGVDARSRAVIITARGEAVFQAARPLWRQAQARLRGAVGDPRIEAMHGMVDALLPLLAQSEADVHVDA